MQRLFSEFWNHPLRKEICGLAIFLVLFLIHDVWYVTTEKVDLNQWLPFLIPLFSVVFIGILWKSRRQERHHVSDEN